MFSRVNVYFNEKNFQFVELTAFHYYLCRQLKGGGMEICMKEFFESIEPKIYKAIKKDVKYILKKIGNEKIYSIALVTDEDCVSLYLAANTSEFLRKKDLDILKFMKQYLSEDEIRGVENGSYSLTRWIPAEWGYSDGKNSGLTKISRLLFEQGVYLNPTEYEMNKHLFFETITSVLKRLIKENVFGSYTNDITFFITLSDGDGIYEIENYSAQQLNSAKVYEKFLHRHKKNRMTTDSPSKN